MTNSDGECPASVGSKSIRSAYHDWGSRLRHHGSDKGLSRRHPTWARRMQTVQRPGTGVWDAGGMVSVSRGSPTGDAMHSYSGVMKAGQAGRHRGGPALLQGTPDVVPNPPAFSLRARE